MWSKGTVEINGTPVTWSVKHFDECSEYGIDGGRISKMTIKIGTKDIVNYDRGWDIKPSDDISIFAFKFLMEKFN